MKNRIRFATLLVTALLALPLTAAQRLHGEGTDSDIRVMSFNLRNGKAKDGEDAWSKRTDLVVQTITDFQPDLLGTQETMGFQGKFIASKLPTYQYVGWSRDASEDGEQCAILFRRERFELKDSGQFWLSETPDEKFSKTWDSSLPRVATWVRLADRENEKRELYFYNTHFDHKGVVARLESGKLIHERIKQQRESLPVVVTGDFNCGEDSEPYVALTGDKMLADTFRMKYPTKEDDIGTFHGFRGIAGTSRIDWVLTTPEFVVKDAAIDRFNRDGRYPSDHFPVTSVIRFK